MAHIIKAFTVLPIGEKAIRVALRLDATGQLISAVPDRHAGGQMIAFEAFMRLPLRLEGTTFQKQVWQVLMDIPWGQTRSYGWVAAQIGRPQAVRAVAQAVGANRLFFRVPCHRVIHADGRLGGFAFGQALKLALLQHENVSNFCN